MPEKGRFGFSLKNLINCHPNPNGGVIKIPLAEMLGEKSKALKADADKISDSISKIKTQLDIYAKELAAKK